MSDSKSSQPIDIFVRCSRTNNPRECRPDSITRLVLSPSKDVTLSRKRTTLRGLRGQLRKAKWLDATDAHTFQAAKQRLKDRRYCLPKQRRSRYVRSGCRDSIYSATLSAVILHHVGTVRPKANPPVEVDAKLKPHWKDSESENTSYRDGFLSHFT
jgi:hypothetical protein